MRRYSKIIADKTPDCDNYRLMNLPTEAAAQFARDQLASGCQTMKQLLIGMMDSKGRVADDVHAIRKLAKSLRGGFSLFQLDKSSALEIQAVSRLLSGPRDAVSRANTWHKLAWIGDQRVAAAITALLYQHTHSASRRPPPETIAWCVDRVDAALNELHQMPTEHLAAQIAAGLARLEHKTFKCFRKLDRRSDKDFHKTRKMLKAWLGADGFLPAEQVTRNPKLEKLADLLGDENDLATLGLWLENHGFTPRFAPTLWKTLKASRRQLQQEVIKDVSRLTPSVSDLGSRACLRARSGNPNIEN